MTVEAQKARTISMKRKRINERAAYSILLFISVIVVVFVIGVIVYIVAKGAGAITWEFLTKPPTDGMRAGGIFPVILGTLYLIIGTIVFSLPIGIFAAVYLNEYARQNRLTRIIRLSIVNMAGVPSVVFGLFGMAFFVLLLGFGRSILAGSLTLAFLILPVIITASEEALKAVPQSYREASLAMGANRWQTIIKVVLPQALPGIITGSVIGIGRAAGETAPIMFTVAAFYQPGLPNSIFSQVMALPFHLFTLATSLTDAPEDIQWGTALVLLMLVLFFATIGTILRTRARLRRKE